MALLTALMSQHTGEPHDRNESESIASSIHASSTSVFLPRRIPLKRIARRRLSANAVDPCFKASTFLACRDVSIPRRFMHSAAATTGEIRVAVSVLGQDGSCRSTAMKAHLFLDCRAKILDQMKPIGYLLGLRCAFTDGLRIQAAAVSADDLDGGMVPQPLGCTIDARDQP